MVGAAQCIIEDPSNGSMSLDVVRITAQEAVLDTTNDFGGSEYLDVALVLAGSPPVALFAQTAGVKDGQLHIRWLHMENGEETALAAILQQWQAGDFDELDLPEDEGALDIFGSAPKKVQSERKGTRRITKPSMDAVQDAGASSTSSSRNKTVSFEAPSDSRVAESSLDEPSRRNKTVTFESPSLDEPSRRNKTVSFENTPLKNRIVSDDIQSAVTPEKVSGTRRIVRPDKPAGETPLETKRQTRRVVRPTQKVDRPEDRQSSSSRGKIPGQEKASVAQTETGAETDAAHDVVIASTERFKKIKSSSGPEGPKKPHKNVVGDDGKLDVGASIRNATKTVSVAELAERHDKLKVLNMSTIKALIAAAVREAIESLGQVLDEKEKESLLKEAEDGFKERLEAFKAEKKGWEAQSSRLRGQLDKAQELLEEEKKRTIEKDQFTVSDAGIIDLEKQFERMLKSASKSGVNADTEATLRDMVSGLLDGERERIAEQARKAQGEAIQLLERKVQRLASSLDETEGERDQARRQANALAAAGGGDVNVQNMYDVGLDDEDANKEAKLALLKDIFAQNKEMRDHLQAKGTKLKTRKKPKVIKTGTPFPEGDAGDSSAADTTKKAAGKTVEEALKAPTDAAVSIGKDGDEDSNADTEPRPEAGADLDGNPDDMPWQPGKSYNPEADFEDGDEDSDEDGSVKKMEIVTKEPPQLERKKKTPKTPKTSKSQAKKSKKANVPAEATSATDASDATVESHTQESQPLETEADVNAHEGNPDDMVWTAPSASDAVDEEDVGSGVKKMTITTDSEPPPLRRGK